MVKINKTYVINLTHRKDRWQQVNNNFKNSSLKLNRWNAVNGKKLDDSKIRELTTNFCYLFCSPGMIGCWLSHATLWKHIVKNKEDNVLIIEDDAFPVPDFNERIVRILQEIPNDYDLVYFGCIGTCEKNINWLYSLLNGKSNKEIYYKNKKLEDIVKPAFPLATHGYMVSYKGALKLLNNEKIKKIIYHIDFSLANYVYDDKNEFRVYALVPPLINQDFDSKTSDIATLQHPLINYPLSKIHLTNSLNMDYFNNVQISYVRKLGVPITIFFVILLGISIFFGLTFSIEFISYYLIFITSIYCLEIFINKGKNVKIMFFELILIILATLISHSIKKNKIN